MLPPDTGELAPVDLDAGGWPDAFRVAPGPRSTVDIIGALKDLGASPSALARILAPFPVAGAASYSNDWGAPRHNPTFHLHEGTDIFAAKGTPVIASADGVVTRIVRGSKVGGNSLRLVARDLTYYYYAHLDGFAPGLSEGQRVRLGDVLGFVGNTGNAVGTPDHLHYEIRPAGGQPVPPVPYLDEWLAAARETVRSFQRAPEAARAAVESVPSGVAGSGGLRLQGRVVEPEPLDLPGAGARGSIAGWMGVLAFVAGVGWIQRRRQRALIAWLKTRR